MQINNKLREALDESRRIASGLGGCRLNDYWKLNEIVRVCEAALSAPPRNCDVYTSDELKVKFKSELASELPIANEHEKNLVAITAMGVIDTLLATATEQEGGDDGNE